MTKQKTGKTGKALVIVESPAKARTIGKFLGSQFNVEASIGHIRDLPEGKKELPAQWKSEPWAYLGVDVSSDFTPIYIVPQGKSSQIKKLHGLLKDASLLYLATDEDREGEAISWHLREVLKPNVPVHRLVFHEITKEAIQDALDHPRAINEDLVKAQETRRIVDRLFGYDVSPLLWRKIRPKLSAGRVQSVAVRLIVDRERERMKFVSAIFWDLFGKFAKQSDEPFEAELVTLGGKRIASGKDFDPATGRLKDDRMVLLNEAEAMQLAARLLGEGGSSPIPFTVQTVEQKPYVSKPSPPFTTSTLQQEANRKLRFTARRTMQIAQSLYENGHITYMRTDSTNLAQVAIEACRDVIRQQFGAQYLPSAPRQYRTNVKNAQEAHEAIRPAGHPFAHPEELRASLSDEEFKVYDMVWKRTIACQMADATGQRMSVTLTAEDAEFQASGKTIDFAGYLRAYVEGSDDPQADLADRERVLPPLAPGEAVSCQQLVPKRHETQPPSRFSEATLTKSLEELGIGRPSTYAAIIDTILAREYVVKRNNALVPTWVAIAVSQLLEDHLANLVDYRFTAKMEDDLDAISRGEAGHVEYLKSFYFGNGTAGLKALLAHKVDEIDPRDVCRIPIGQPEGQEQIVVRVGRYGPFLQQGDRRAAIPEDLAPDELNIAKASELLDRAMQAEEPLGHCPETGLPVYLKIGRFGPYVQRGQQVEGGEKPKNASLIKGMTPESVDLGVALKLLSLPRELGQHPDSGLKIIAANGRFGPYVKCGDDTRSLSAGMSPMDVTLEQALELLAQPKQASRRFGVVREPIKVFAESPVTGEPIKIMDGRYGKYVTDGVTNATLPKEVVVEEFTLPAALALLAERAAQGPPKKKRGRQAARTGTKAATKSESGAASPRAAPAKRRAATATAAANGKQPAARAAKTAAVKSPAKSAAKTGGKPPKAAKPKGPADDLHSPDDVLDALVAGKISREDASSRLDALKKASRAKSRKSPAT